MYISLRLRELSQPAVTWHIISHTRKDAPRIEIVEITKTFAHGLAHRLLGFWASFRLYFFIFLISQGLHTLNNKTLIIVHN